MEGQVRACARRGLAIYFAVVVVGTGLVEGLMIRTGKPISQLTAYVMPLMWMPALASVVARVANREGIRDVSFRFGGMRGLRWLAIAWVFPLVVGLLAYGPAWITGLERFSPPALKELGLSGASPAARAGVLLALTTTIGVPFSAISAAGEEIGWRGYMTTRLVDAGVKRPVLVGGIAWGLWHVPLIVSGQYAAGPRPVLSAIVFLVSITAGSYVAARVRLESGSVWPAVVFHAAWNSIIQGFFDGATAGGDSSRTTSIWIGESGLLVLAASVLCTIAIARGAWTMRRFPKDEPVPMTAP